MENVTLPRFQLALELQSARVMGWTFSADVRSRRISLKIPYTRPAMLYTRSVFISNHREVFNELSVDERASIFKEPFNEIVQMLEQNLFSKFQKRIASDRGAFVHDHLVSRVASSRYTFDVSLTSGVDLLRPPGAHLSRLPQRRYLADTRAGVETLCRGTKSKIDPPQYPSRLHLVGYTVSLNHSSRL